MVMSSTYCSWSPWYVSIEFEDGSRSFVPFFDDEELCYEYFDLFTDEILEKTNILLVRLHGPYLVRNA